MQVKSVFFALALCLFLSFQLAAQGGDISDPPIMRTVTGQVLDSSTAMPVQGLELRILYQGEYNNENVDVIVTVVTNPDGIFSIRLPLANVYNIKAIKAGNKLSINQILPNNLFAQIRLISTSTHSLQVTVHGTGNDKKMLEAAGGYAVIGENLRRGDNSSLQQGLNTIPGVRMESRGSGGSARISLRGSIQRAPFGIRNIKLYLDDIPLTSPDGSGSLEEINPSYINMEIMKGPAAALYGVGTGGALIARTKLYPQDQLFHVSARAGSNGFYRLDAGTALSFKKGQVQIGYTKQQYDGYRQQEFNYTDQIMLKGQYIYNDRLSYTGLLLLSRGGWGLPGSLTAAEAAADPKQALPYSVNAKAALYRERVRAGITQRAILSSKWWNSTTVFFTAANKENPYGTSAFFQGYKFEKPAGGGVRSSFQYTSETKAGVFSYTGGAEYQGERNAQTEYVNASGSSGALKTDALTRTTQAFAFSQAEFAFRNNLKLTAGASLNAMNYDLQDRYGSDSIDNSLQSLLPLNVSPKVSLVKTFRDSFSIFAQVSSGFSPPTVWEMVNPAGGYTQLKAEQGINYEAGSRGILPLRTKWAACFTYDVTVYTFRLQNAILPYSNAQGQTYYKNAGATVQNGLEAMLIFNRGSSGAYGLPELQLGYSLYDYRFAENSSGATDLKGKLLPGTPRQTLSALADWNFKYFNVQFTGYWNDKTPLDDANIKYRASYFTLDCKAATVRRTLWKKLGYSIFAGVNNVSNTQYTAYLQINDAKGRFFNPAPGRTFYGELNISFLK